MLHRCVLQAMLLHQLSAILTDAMCCLMRSSSIRRQQDQ